MQRMQESFTKASLRRVRPCQIRFQLSHNEIDEQKQKHELQYY